MLFAFLRHLDRRRISPFVVFLNAGSFEREVAAMGFRTAIVRTGRLRNLATGMGAVRELARLLEEERPRLLLNWMAKAHLYGGIAAVLTSLRPHAVWWQHELTTGHWIDRAAALVPAVAVGCSSRSSAMAQQRWQRRQHTFVVHPGIDEPVRLTGPVNRQLRAQLAIDDDVRIIGTAGRLQRSKGQHRVIEAVAELRARGHRVHGLIVGGDAHRLSPDYEPSLRELAATMGVADALTFTGHVPDAGRYLQLMDVLVHAADAEPFGIVLIEAMALGVPLVAFDVAGPSEIIEPERSGLLVPAGDDAGLVRAIERLLTDAGLRQRLRLGGLERYRGSFTAQRMSQQLEQQLLGLAS